MNTVRISLFFFCFLAHAAAAAPAIPLTFEQRGPSLFVARTGSGSLQFRSTGVTLGGITLRFPDSRKDVRLEGLGGSSPSTYVSDKETHTYRQYPKLAI